MNFHSDKWIIENVNTHYKESLNYFPSESIIGIFLQGSQNYQMDTEKSDIDTKLIVLPTFRDLVFANKPVSTTHVRENNEHIDFKDMRLMMDTYRKGNINFVETLFTPYKIINPKYADLWDKLESNKEEIAHYNIFNTVKAMKGIALEKYHAMEHEYPTKVDIIKEYGYDCKQLHHLLRIKEFLTRYVNGESYENCLIPTNADYLVQVKKNLYSLSEARKIADNALNEIDLLCIPYVKNSEFDKINFYAETILVETQYTIFERGFYN